MGTRSEVIEMVKSMIRLIDSMGYSLVVDGDDLDLHDHVGWIITVGKVEVEVEVD